MKKALIVSNSSGLVTLFLKNDVEILKSKGYEIDCACNTNYPDKNTRDFFELYNIKVFHIDFPIRNLNVNALITSYKQLKEIMKRNFYNVMHCHSTIAAALARQCSKKYRNNIKKVIYTSHGFPFCEGNDGLKAKIFYRIEDYLSKYTDAIITICIEDFKNAEKMKCKNVKYMHGVGIDIYRFTNMASDKYSYREKFGLKKDDKIILSVGEINTNKNHQIIIKAMSIIDDKKMIYVICGREVTENGKKKELQDLANSLDVRILFLGFRKDIPEICQCADIGAIPSYKEGLGLSGIEMLASGIPVVGSVRQGIKDYIVDGETGYLADPNDSEAFAEAILKTFELSKDERTKENCYQMAKKFNSEQAYEVIKSVYDSLISREIDNKR